MTSTMIGNFSSKLQVTVPMDSHTVLHTEGFHGKEYENAKNAQNYEPVSVGTFE